MNNFLPWGSTQLTDLHWQLHLVLSSPTWLSSFKQSPVIDRSTLTATLGTVITYLLILIQTVTCNWQIYTDSYTWYCHHLLDYPHSNSHLQQLKVSKLLVLVTCYLYSYQSMRKLKHITYLSYEVCIAYSLSPFIGRSKRMVY